jgi:hypothetical protein
MLSTLIRFNESTLDTLCRWLRATGLLRTAIRAREYARIREGYLRQPDSADDADDWSNADEFGA